MTTATMPQNQTIDVGLKSRALRVTLHVHAWTNIKSVPEAAKRSKTGKYLIDPKELKAVNTALRAIKDDHDRRTLPWEDGGTRVLSSSGYMAYQESQRHLINKLAAEVVKLQSRWEGLVEQSMAELGDLAGISDYPTADELSERFNVTSDMDPITEAKDVRLQVSEEEVARIQQHIEDRHVLKMAGIMADIESRIRSVAERAYTSLRDYKPAEPGKRAESDFRDTLVANVRELVDLLPSLNITNSEKISRLRLDLMEVSRYDTKQLKGDAALREKTAAAAQAILDKLEDFI